MSVVPTSVETEPPVLPVEMVRSVLSLLTPNPYNTAQAEGGSWEAFLALRLSSKELKEEVEAAQPWAVQALAEKGASRLLQVCADQNAVPEEVEHHALLSPLKTLRVERSHLGCSTSGAAIVRQVIAHAVSLESLILTDGVANDDFLAGISLDRSLCPRLVSLDVGASPEGLTTRGTGALGDIVPFLEHMRLCRSDFRPALCPGSLEQLPLLEPNALKSLSLRCCGLHASEAAADVALILAASSSLVHLDISYNRMDRLGAAALSDGLKACPTLVRLDVSGNRLASDGLAALELVATSISDLDIRLNNIQSLAALHLETNNQLRSLSLSGDNMPLEQLCLASNQALEMVEVDWMASHTTPRPTFAQLGLSGKTTLSALRISDMKFFDSTAVELRDQLLQSSVKKLVIESYNLVDRQMVTIASGINQNLEELEFSCKHVSDEGVRALRLRDNNTLRSLDFSDCFKVTAAAAATVFSNPWQAVKLVGARGIIRGGALGSDEKGEEEGR